MGALFFPSTLLLGGISAGANAPPWVTIVLDVAISILLLRAIARSLGAQQGQAHKMALATGLLVPITCFGFVASISLPLILAIDFALVLFSRKLWRRYRVQPATSPMMLPLTPPAQNS